MNKQKVLLCLVTPAFMLFGCSNGGNSSSVSNISRAYVTNVQDNTISICNIDGNGNLSNCQKDTAEGKLSSPDGVLINKNNIFIANLLTNSITICALNTNGGLTNCINNREEGIIYKPYGQAIYNSYYYVTNSNNTIAICKIGTDGNLSACKLDNANNTLKVPGGIAISNNKAFITNIQDGSITTCQIGRAGEFTSCNAQKYGEAASLNDIYINSSMIYATSIRNKLVQMCPLSSDAIIAAKCKEIKLGYNEYFKMPTGIFVRGKHLYSVDFGSDSVIKCDFAPKDGLTNCSVANASNGFVSPTDIEISEANQ